jgi:glucan phosphoethanolaminetransferase (alkaline phosphatase superfamily)
MKFSILPSMPGKIRSFLHDVTSDVLGFKRRGLIFFGILVLLLMWPGIYQFSIQSGVTTSLAGWRALLFGAILTTLALCLTRRVWLNILLLLPLILFQPVEWYSVTTYDSQITPAMFAVFFLSNIRETTEFLAGKWLILVLIVAAWISTISFFVWYFYRSALCVSLRLRLTLLGLLLLLLPLAIVTPHGIRCPLETWADTPFVGSALRFGIMMQESRQVERLRTDRLQYRHEAKSLRPAENQLIIVILGESVRAGNFQHYGSPRPTTPRLMARSGITVLSDVAACSNLTTLAVPPALTGFTPGDATSMNRTSSVVAALREAGFHTAWFSNQSPTGRWDELVASYAGEADEVHWMNVAPIVSEWGQAYDYDDSMIASAQKCVALSATKTAIFLHMQGSHIRYEKRCRERHRVFQPDAGPKDDYRANPERMRNSYDNSIVMTDEFIDAAIALHAASARPGFVLFMGDHGESLLDNGTGFLGHGSVPPPEQELRVPWLIWAPETERHNHPTRWQALEANRQKPASTRSFFATLLDLAEIHWKNRDPTWSLADPNYETHPRKVLDVNWKLLDFDGDICGKGKQEKKE